MDLHKNLEFSLFPHHDTSSSMLSDDMQYNSLQRSQRHDLCHDAFHQLPGTGITPHTSTPSRQVEASLLPQLERQTKIQGYASRMPATIPFLGHDQSDGSEPSLHAPSPPSSVSPPPSETCSFRLTFPSKSQIFVKCVLMLKGNLRCCTSMPFGSNAGYYKFSSVIPNSTPPALSDLASSRTILYADNRHRRQRSPFNC
jgi:hypothetical protein